MRFKAHRIDATYPLGQVMACGTQHCVRAHLLEKASERLAACYMTAERCAGKQLLEGSIKSAPGHSLQCRLILAATGRFYSTLIGRFLCVLGFGCRKIELEASRFM